MAVDIQQAQAGLEYRTLVEIFEHSIANYAERQLFGVKRDGEYVWLTYGEFGERVDRCRALLADLGMEVGDTVAIIADNCPEWAIGAYATYTLGARWCPMYEAQAEKEWAYILNDSGAKMALVADESIAHALDRMCNEGAIDLEHVIHLEGGEEGRFDTLLDQVSHEAAPVQPDGDDICGLIYTSGTTGDPKGVLLSHRNIASNIEAIHDFDLISPDDISLAFLPWAHSFGQTAELHGMFSVGAKIGLVEDISKITDNLQEIRPTLLFSVPRIFNRIHSGIQAKLHEEGGLKKKLFQLGMQNSERLRDERERMGEASPMARMKDKFFDKLVFSKVRDRFGGRLKYAISGGAKLSPEVAYFIDNLHITVCEGYGLTETSPMVSVNLPDQRKIGSVGRPVPGVEVRIEPREGHPNGEGEVCVRGPNIMQGYHNKPDKTAEVIDDEGFFHTGDLGCIDDDGFLWIVGRAKEEYKLTNGKYVAPNPLEEKLKLAPHIDQVMIDGQDRPFNIAIINVDREALERWAEKHGTPTDNLVEHHEVRELIEREVEERSSDFKSFEKCKDFILVDDEWTPENGVLTPTLKLKRRVIREMYDDQIEELYRKRES